MKYIHKGGTMRKYFLILTMLYSINSFASPPSCVEFEIDKESLNSSQIRLAHYELIDFVNPLLQSGDIVVFSNFSDGIKVRVESLGVRHFNWNESRLFVQVNYSNNTALKIIRKLLSLENLNPRPKHTCF